jgi:DNA-directed RNA polymerase subunit RPC12/RpoP|tara:strand:- start:2134 stop:2256 length:123 start_codon:yes stop_codon:yes gene_type:complete
MEFKCPKCKRTFDSTSRTKDKYCPECEMILRPTKDTVFEK